MKLASLSYKIFEWWYDFLKKILLKFFFARQKIYISGYCILSYSLIGLFFTLNFCNKIEWNGTKNGLVYFSLFQNYFVISQMEKKMLTDLEISRLCRHLQTFLAIMIFLGLSWWTGFIQNLKLTEQWNQILDRKA